MNKNIASVVGSYFFVYSGGEGSSSYAGGASTSADRRRSWRLVCVGAAPLRAYPKNESIGFISRAVCASWVTAVAGAGSDEVRGGGTTAAEEVEAAEAADMIVVEVLSRWGAESLKC